MIGRKKEIAELKGLYEKNKAELVAIYGRRRVGKTFLIDETFSGKITFRHAGLSPMDTDSKSLLASQLNHFYNSLIMQGMKPSKRPKNWFDAFLLLELYLQKIDDGSRQLVFLDELPWMDTPKSNFIQAFEAFWNSWGCHRKNLMVIICGSANSWMLDNLINNHGGLYNRVTYEIKLSPFTLKECEEFYIENNIKFSQYDIVQSDMILGGIPYYMEYLKPSLSLVQNVDELFFNQNAKLVNEYDRLFSSVFTNPTYVKNIVELLAGKSVGYRRSEIVAKLKITDGSKLSNYLNALISSDLIIKYVPYGKSKKEPYYKLIDSFCLFYLNFVKGRDGVTDNYWQNNFASQSLAVWRGYAFENICFKHINEIKKALGISGVSSMTSALIKLNDETSSQIDMIILRKDNVINVCELKFYNKEFTVSKDYYKIILAREDSINSENKTAVVHNTLITTFGIVKNEYSSIFNDVISLADLFS